jgi:hypothetical protein
LDARGRESRAGPNSQVVFELIDVFRRTNQKRLL